MKSRHCKYEKYTLCNFCRYSNDCSIKNYEMYTKIGGNKIVIGYCEDI